jgi:enoyl-CoA hydratase
MPTPTVRDDNEIRWITFDRPEAANALRPDDLEPLADAVRGIGPDVRAIAFTGAGERAFCAGMHLDTFAELDPPAARRMISRLADLLRAVRQAPVATVAVLNGACIGAALELALACDLRTARPGVRLGLPEVKLGIPSVVDAALLPAFVGLSRAREMILTGDLYDLDAFGPGFANRVAEPAELLAATRELLARVTAPTREVVAAQKALFETWLEHGISTSVAASVDVFAGVFAEPATRAAVAAYRRS